MDRFKPFFIFLSIHFVLFSLAVARDTESRFSYYGRSVYSIAENNQGSEILRNQLFFVLSQVHSVNENDFDDVGRGCSEKCYQHTSIGYDRARTFLLGYFYLVPHGKEWGVKEVYCEAEIGSRQFGKSKPGPGRIPDNEVVNVEHTWPQSRFTGKFPRELQKSDLHHLYPTDSNMNSSRSSYPFGEVEREKQRLKCDESKLGTTAQGGGIYFEPPENHKGNVARSLFYFAVRYQSKIDSIQEDYLRDWHVNDPPDEEEKRRNDEIFKVQGNRNPFIDHPSWVELIADF